MLVTVRDLVRDESGGAVGNVAICCLVVVAGTMVIQPPQVRPLLSTALEKARAHMPESFGRLERTLDER
jgi:hypothetical protein